MLALETDRGTIRTRYRGPDDPRAGVVWLAGVGQGFDSPARGLYGELASILSDRGISSLRLLYRQPGNLDECVLDAMAGVALLESFDLHRLGIVGHSFGGAVAIRAAVRCDSVLTVVTLASQSHGADLVDQLFPRSLLLIHGEADRTLPPYCSADLYSKALEPKELLLMPETGHRLNESRDRLLPAISDWLLRWLDEGRS